MQHKIFLVKEDICDCILTPARAWLSRFSEFRDLINTHKHMSNALSLMSVLVNIIFTDRGAFS